MDSRSGKLSQSLTPRQSEYLEFIREYIKENKSSPQLMEIANHFYVTRPTASNMLKALEEKGVIYSKRDAVTGFYIRTPERSTPEGHLREIVIAGNLDRYGELQEFPNQLGHFPFMLPNDTGDVFGVDVDHHIPSEGILARDRLIFTNGGKAKPGDICIYPWGKRWFLIRVYDLVLDETMPFYKLALTWDDSLNKLENHLFWWPLVDVTAHGRYLAEIAEEQDVSWHPIQPDHIVGKLIRLVRRLAI